MWQLNSNSIKSINVWLMCHMMRRFINHFQLRDIIMNQSIQPDSHSVSSLSPRWWYLRNIWDEVKINLSLWSLLVLLIVLSSFPSSLITMTDWWDDFILWWVCWSSSSSFYLMASDSSFLCDVNGVIIGVHHANYTLYNIHNSLKGSCVWCVEGNDLPFVHCDYSHLPPSIW